MEVMQVPPVSPDIQACLMQTHDAPCLTLFICGMVKKGTCRFEGSGCMHACSVMPEGCSPTGSSVHQFSRQQYWSRFPFPLLGEFHELGIKPKSLGSPVLAGRFLTTAWGGKIWKRGRNNTTQTVIPRLQRCSSLKLGVYLQSLALWQCDRPLGDSHCAAMMWQFWEV